MPGSSSANDLTVNSLPFRCNYEKQLFQECFIRSVRAIRAPFNNEDSGSDSFGDSAQRYRGAVDQCFIKSNVKRSGHFDASAIFLDG